MNLFLRIDINIVAMILLAIIFFMAFNRLDHKNKVNNIFLKMSVVIILELFFETATCVINGYSQSYLINVSSFLHMCLFITAPILTFLWFIFIRNWMVPSNAVQKEFPILLIPIAVNLIITVLSPVYGFVFTIDSSNLYHRGDYFLVSSAITYFYIIYSFVLIIRQKHKIIKEDFYPLLIFGILPLIGGLFQTLFYGALLMWSSCAFSLVIVYIFLQKRMIHLDALTGVWTRGSLDYYLSQRLTLHTKENAGNVGVVFIDLDGLKHINDEFGHIEGDNAIKTSIELIKNTLRKTDIVARFGGDEFVVIIDCESKQGLEQTIERIRSNFLKYNKGSNKAYKLECSFGFDILNSSYETINHFFHHIDNLMYLNKKQKKEIHPNFSNSPT